MIWLLLLVGLICWGMRSVLFFINKQQKTSNTRKRRKNIKISVDKDLSSVLDSTNFKIIRTLTRVWWLLEHRKNERHELPSELILIINNFAIKEISHRLVKLEPPSNWIHPRRLYPTTPHIVSLKLTAVVLYKNIIKYYKHINGDVFECTPTAKSVQLFISIDLNEDEFRDPSLQCSFDDIKRRHKHVMSYSCPNSLQLIKNLIVKSSCRPRKLASGKIVIGHTGFQQHQLQDNITVVINQQADEYHSRGISTAFDLLISSKFGECIFDYSVVRSPVRGKDRVGLSQSIMKYVERGDLKGLKESLRNINSTTARRILNNEKLLKTAITSNSVTVVRYLLKQPEFVMACDDKTFINTLKSNIRIAETLLPICDVTPAALIEILNTSRSLFLKQTMTIRPLCRIAVQEPTINSCLFKLSKHIETRNLILSPEKLSLAMSVGMPLPRDYHSDRYQQYSLPGIVITFAFLNRIRIPRVILINEFIGIPILGSWAVTKALYHIRMKSSQSCDEVADYHRSRNVKKRQSASRQTKRRLTAIRHVGVSCSDMLKIPIGP